MSKQQIICADVIARYGSKFVLLERLSSVPGLAFPGGKQDPGESLSGTAKRELWEETGLSFIIEGTQGTYAEQGRDPRGNYISTVFTGVAYGHPRDEPGKTRVILLEKAEVIASLDLLVLDHAKIFRDFLHLSDGR